MYHYIFKYFIVPVLGKKGLKGYEEFLEQLDIDEDDTRCLGQSLKMDYGKFLKKCDINLLKENGLMGNDNSLYDDEEASGLLRPKHYLRSLSLLSYADEQLKMFSIVQFLKFFKDFVKFKDIKNLKDIDIEEYLNWFKENIKNGRVRRLKKVENLKRESKKLLKMRMDFKEEFAECFKNITGFFPTARYDEMLIKNFVRSHRDLDVKKYIQMSFNSDAVKNNKVNGVTVNLLVSNKWFDYIQSLMSQKVSNDKIEIKYL